jgi:hypothetical protein
MTAGLIRFYYEDLGDAPPRFDQVFEDVSMEDADRHEEELKTLKIDYIRIPL